MKSGNDNPNLRRGQFIWRDEASQKRYVESITGRIQAGYYSSDKVLSKIVEELAPALSESVGEEPVGM
jgi:hypothetical protein